MLFNSIEFMVFFPVVTSLYFTLPHRFRWMLLLAGSCYFYMAFVPAYILILAFTIIVDYTSGIIIDGCQGVRRKVCLTISLIANISVLALFKYYNFASENVSYVCAYLAVRNPIPHIDILLPIGLSFHTFQSISYIIEVYRGRQKPEKHFGIYALYVMYYPQLVAGPIERPQNILHQFHKYHCFDYQRVTDGMKLMAWGFFKKVVIADNLASIVNPVFNDVHGFQGLSLVIAVLAFSFQIFCDFSGYSDIAIGASQVMGIKLMENFKRPYYSKSISEFWSRWHISLSSWFKDYLYIPLGGNRVAANRWYLNLLIVFLVSGLWHGASWTFIIWGALHGFYIIFSIASESLRNKISEAIGFGKPSIIKSWVNIWATYSLVAFAWVFFRANTISDAIYVIKNMFNGIYPEQVNQLFSVWVGGKYTKLAVSASLILMGGVHYYQEKYGSVRARIAQQRALVRWGIYLVAVFSIILLGAFQNAQFIYFRF